MSASTTAKTWRERLGVGADYPLHAPTDVERAMVAEIAELRAVIAADDAGEVENGRRDGSVQVDPRTLRAALRAAWMAGRVGLGDAHWARADEYALKTLSHWNAAAEVTDWCPGCHARESRAQQDPLGDPGEKREWLSTLIHRLPCVPAISGLSPDQYQVYRLGWRHAVNEAGKLAKNYVDPRVASARRMTARAERVIAELIGAPAPIENEGTEKIYEHT